MTARRAPGARSLSYYLNIGALGRGNAAEAVQNYGRWCGGPNCGMLNCCDGKACAACMADSDAMADTGSARCLAECPPVDEVDTLCMRHDFCVSAQLMRLGGFGNCSYRVPGGFSAPVPANECACDAALYRGVLALGGRDGFKGNLLAWLSSSWGRCLDTDADGQPAGCLPFHGNVAPLVRAPGDPGAASTRLAAGLGVTFGALLPLATFLAVRACRRRRAGQAAAAAAASGAVGEAGDCPLLAGSPTRAVQLTAVR
jgi:hypothetical protein